MKNKIYACYCCNIHRDDLAKPNVLPCADCCRLGQQNPCFHKEVSDETVLERLKVECRELFSTHAYLRDYPFKQSKVKIGNNQIRSTRTDDCHIDFDYTSCSVTRRVAFIGLLKKELRLRNQEIPSQQPASMHLQLKELLVLEDRYKVLKSVTEEQNLDRAMIKLEKAIPCLLHLENRISEAMLTHLLHKGLSIREGNKQECNNLMRAVERCMNESFFGTPEAPSAWQFPVNDDNTMGEIKLANWRARRVIEHIEEIVIICVQQSDQVRWNDTFNLYRQMIKVCIC